MSRNCCWIGAALLSLAVAGMLLHAKEAASAKNEPAVPKRHKTKSKPKRRSAQSTPTGQPKQYGRVVLEDVRVNALGVHCTIKRVHLLYKGDGIDTGIVGNVLALGESDTLSSVLELNEVEKAAIKTPQQPEKEPALLKRLAEDKKDVKVVLWTYMALDPRQEFIEADRRLAEKLTEDIRKLSGENSENVTIVQPYRVELYKDRHPNWQALELATVGHDFNADYVIVLEIDKLSLYEPNANRQLYRGKTEIFVSLKDMKNPNGLASKEFTDCYPREARGDMTPLDISPYQFRDNFLDHVSKQLVLYFVDHKRQTRTALMDE